MLFINCERCSNIGTRVCGCENSPHLFCDSCAKDHIISLGKHSIEPALEGLTASEVSLIAEAYSSYRLCSLRQAIQIKNTRIEELIQEIRRVEQEYSSVLESILSGPIARDIQQVLSYRALPLFSDSSVVGSLLNLKQVPDFSTVRILDLFNSLNSPLMSSFSSQTSAPSNASVQPSSIPLSSSQAHPSRESPTQTVDPANYRWEILQQTQAHNKGINSIAVSECERYIASGSEDRTINVLELQTLCPLLTLEGHTDWVTSVSFLGNKVVSGSRDKTIKIWDEDRCEKTLNLHSDGVYSVCVSSCKRLIVSGSYDKTAVVFRFEDNKTLHTLAHPSYVLSVAFSRNNKEIVSGSGYFDFCGFGGKGEIRIWKTETGELLNTLNAHSRPVTCVNFSGKFILSSSLDNTVKIWDRDKIVKSRFWNENEPLLAFSDHNSSVVSVDVRDNILASLSMDDRIIVRDLRSSAILQTLKGHGIYYKFFDYVPMVLKVLEGGKLIVSGGQDRNVKVWRRVN